MTLDYEATDGKSDSHAVVLGCIKSLKKSVHSLGIKADAHILYGEPHLIVCVSFRFTLQLPGSIVHRSKRGARVGSQPQRRITHQVLATDSSLYAFLTSAQIFAIPAAVLTSRQHPWIATDPLTAATLSVALSARSTTLAPS